MKQSKYFNVKLFFAAFALSFFVTLLIGGLFISGSVQEWIVKWQTLIAGLIALGGALATIWFLDRHHKIEQKRIEGEQKNEGRYLRSSLSDALSELTKYSKECFFYIYHFNKNWKFPQKPENAIEVLRQNIKYATKKNSNALFDVALFYQKHNSRLSSYKANADDIFETENLYFDIIKLYYFFNRTFYYADDKSEDIQIEDFPPLGDLMSSLILIVGANKIDDYKDVLGMLRKKYEREGRSLD